MPSVIKALPLCPSSRPEVKNSLAFGIVVGSAKKPRVAYLSEPQAVTDQLLSIAKPVTPTEVFRFAATCAERDCEHFNGSDCQLVKRIINKSPMVVENLPSCRIRADCRWWQQEGKSACFRCPQIVTDIYNSTE